MRSHDRLFDTGALLLILSLAAYLRLANLAHNPGWYTDEGTHLDIARHLIDGHVQYLAVDQSTLLFSRLPLFEALLAIWSRIFGLSLEALRTLTGVLGVVSVGALYGVVRRISRDRGLALLAALLLAIYPPAVLYSRFGFSYNLLTPLMLIAWLGAWHYSHDRSRRWLAVSALSIGLGAISDLWMLIMFAPLAVSVVTRNWRDAVWSLPLALLPLSVYVGVMLLTASQAFLFDARFVLSRVNQLSLVQQVQTVWQNVLTLSAQDGWFALGAIGWLGLRPPRLRWLTVISAGLPFVLLARTTALFSLSFYYMIPLLPFIPLGVASLLWTGVAIVSSNRNVSNLLIGALTMILLAVTLPPLIDQVNQRFRTDIDPFLIEPVAAQQAAAFVNAHSRANDLVIASPAIAWQLASHVADFQMSIAFAGQATPHLPADLPAERWAFDPRYRRARFVIVDNLWRNWAMSNVSGTTDLLRQVEAWPLVFRVGEVEVYANPRVN